MISACLSSVAQNSFSVILTDQWQWVALLETACGQVHEKILLNWMQQAGQQKAGLDHIQEDSPESSVQSLLCARSANYSRGELGWDWEVKIPFCSIFSILHFFLLDKHGNWWWNTVTIAIFWIEFLLAIIIFLMSQNLKLKSLRGSDFFF